MYSAAFIFEPGQYDAEFHTLNELIDKAARANDGFIGTESWQSADGKIRNVTYYWKTLESLKEFSHFARHLEAKRQYRNWYNAYHIVVSEVIRSYGDGRIAHLTPNERSSGA
jgi:heme-degrading monooxygenase HmoA